MSMKEDATIYADLLMDLAAKRKFTSYEGLRDSAVEKGARKLATVATRHVLTRIWEACKKDSLPYLTLLVVSKASLGADNMLADTSFDDEGFLMGTNVHRRTVPDLQQQVMAYNWNTVRAKLTDPATYATIEEQRIGITRRMTPTEAHAVDSALAAVRDEPTPGNGDKFEVTSMKDSAEVFRIQIYGERGGVVFRDAMAEQVNFSMSPNEAIDFAFELLRLAYRESKV